MITRQDDSTKHFTFLSEILHMVDRQDLVAIYVWVTEYYKSHKPQGNGVFYLEIYMCCLIQLSMLEKVLRSGKDRVHGL